MKAGISNIWLLGMVALFIFLFSCYVIISVNYTKSFKMKNEVLSIIERGKGVTGLVPGSAANSAPWTGKVASSKIVPGENVHTNVAAFQTINLYLLGNAYDARGKCPQEDGEACWYGVSSLLKNEFEIADQKQKYYYCFAKFKKSVVFDDDNDDNEYTRYYYKVRLFYELELPVLGDWLSVKVDGKTGYITDIQDGSHFTNMCSVS